MIFYTVDNVSLISLAEMSVNSDQLLKKMYLLLHDGDFWKQNVRCI